jgi:hypothetical protein
MGNSKISCSFAQCGAEVRVRAGEVLKAGSRTERVRAIAIDLYGTVG